MSKRKNEKQIVGGHQCNDNSRYYFPINIVLIQIGNFDVIFFSLLIRSRSFCVYVFNLK